MYGKLEVTDDVNKKWCELSGEEQNILLYGSRTRGGERMEEHTCPDCGGKRLNPQTFGSAHGDRSAVSVVGTTAVYIPFR